MNRIGIFTGNIYRDDEMPKVGECCVMISDEKLDDENYIRDLVARNSGKCNGCYGCPASLLNPRGAK